MQRAQMRFTPPQSRAKDGASQGSRPVVGTSARLQNDYGRLARDLEARMTARKARLGLTGRCLLSRSERLREWRHRAMLRVATRLTARLALTGSLVLISRTGHEK